MLNDAVVNDWLVRSPFSKAKKGELIAIAHEATGCSKSKALVLALEPNLTVRFLRKKMRFGHSVDNGPWVRRRATPTPLLLNRLVLHQQISFPNLIL